MTLIKGSLRKLGSVRGNSWFRGSCRVEFQGEDGGVQAGVCDKTGKEKRSCYAGSRNVEELVDLGYFAFAVL